MSLKSIEQSTSFSSFYSLRDKAFAYAHKVRMDAYDKIEAVRKSIDSPQKLAAYQEKLRLALGDVIGELPYDKTFPLSPRYTGQREEGSLLIKNVIFQSRKGVYITANLYIPHDRPKKCPAVLLQCGHSANGKAKEAYQAAARIIARAGIIVLVTDPMGQGERMEYISQSGKAVLNTATRNHQQAGTQCFLCGYPLIRYFLADALRSVDFLCSLDEVDSSKIGATGISGGGTMTSLLMAYDRRIAAAAPGCWPSAGREYFAAGSAPDSEQIWPNALTFGIDVFELMACMCPRPLLLLAAEYDFIPIEGVKRLHTETARLYGLAGAEKNVQLSIAKEPHGYSLVSAMHAATFFAEHLTGKSYTPSGGKVTPLEDRHLHCTATGLVLTDFPDAVTVYEENLALFRQHTPVTESQVYEFLHNAVYSGRTEPEEIHVRSLTGSDNAFYDDGLWVQKYLWLTQDAMPCCGILLKAADNREKEVPVTICLWLGGTDSLCVHSEKIRDICASGRAAFVVDLSTMGKCKPNNLKGNADPGEALSSATDKIAKSLFLTGDSLCAVKAYDLLQTIKMAKAEFCTDDIALYTTGNYCVFGRIIQVLRKDVLCAFENEVRICDIITSRYYNTYDTAQIIMPGIGKYLGEDER